MPKENLYTLCYEVGAAHAPLPIWASHQDNPLELTPNPTVPSIIPIHNVPTAFRVTSFLSTEESLKLIKLAESLGFEEDAAVSLPRYVRHNESLVWIADKSTHNILWNRCKSLLEEHLKTFTSKKPLGINQRFRFYKYNTGDFFKPHTDGAWPASAVLDGKLITNAHPDRYSLMTFLIFLNDDFEGGETAFYVHKDDPTKAAKRSKDVKVVAIKPLSGSVLCFAHGTHAQHCMHGSKEIIKGSKYIIRTDLLFEL